MSSLRKAVRTATFGRQPVVQIARDGSASRFFADTYSHVLRVFRTGGDVSGRPGAVIQAALKPVLLVSAKPATTAAEIVAAAGSRSAVFAGIIVDWRRADFIIARANQNNRLGQRA